MKKRIISMTIFFVAVLSILTGILCFSEKQISSKESKAEQILAVNEIEQLAKSGEYDQIVQKAQDLQQSIRQAEVVSGDRNGLLMMWGICVLFLVVIFCYVYFAILRPFDKMKHFANEIAQGNFEVPLDYERSNYFGAFTWAFDSMRREITKARSCEKEAIENNKTVIATLSHDIKTPISSIRAYTEGLEANMDSSPEKRQKYLSVIMKKCDEVSSLTNDLFLHSLSDLDKLKINPESMEVCGFMKEILCELSVEEKDICFETPDFTAPILADKNRLTQIAENLINNARKYAKSKIEVWIVKKEGWAEIHFRDYGQGIPDEDMPFIFHKFYRGKNCGEEQGSGLGLYIVKYLTEQMQGKLLLHNHGDVLEAVVSFPMKKSS